MGVIGLWSESTYLFYAAAVSCSAELCTQSGPFAEAVRFLLDVEKAAKTVGMLGGPESGILAGMNHRPDWREDFGESGFEEESIALLVLAGTGLNVVRHCGCGSRYTTVR